MGGGKLCFLTLRMDLATVQAVVFGQVVVPEVATSCSQSEVEINVEKIFCIGRSKPLPLLLADASRSEADLAKDPSLIRVGRDVRLDNRIIDLRTNSSQAIMRG